MNWRLDRYGVICAEWWLEIVEELWDSEEPITKILIAGLDGDICLHVVQVEFDGEEVQEALGYPTEDKNGAPFDYPAHIDLLDENESFRQWADIADLLDDEGEFDDEEIMDALGELFIALHNYELKRSLVMLEDKMAIAGIELDEDYQAGLAHHDDEDLESLEDEREAVFEEMQQWTPEQLSLLLSHCYVNPARIDEWLS